MNLKLCLLYRLKLNLDYSEFSGLVHKSQMSNTRLETPADMAARGDSVYCKVIKMEVGQSLSYLPTE